MCANIECSGKKKLNEQFKRCHNHKPLPTHDIKRKSQKTESKANKTNKKGKSDLETVQYARDVGYKPGNSNP